jgi:hypothetical protein
MQTQFSKSKPQFEWFSSYSQLAAGCVAMVLLLGLSTDVCGQQLGERRIKRIEVDLRCSNTKSAGPQESIHQPDPGWAIVRHTPIHVARAFGNYEGSVFDVQRASTFVSADSVKRAYDEAYDGFLKSGQNEKAAAIKAASNSSLESMRKIYASHRTIGLRGYCEGEGIARGGGAYKAWIDIEELYIGSQDGFQLQQEQVLNGQNTRSFQTSIVSPLTKMALDVPGGARTPGLQMIQWPEHGKDGQRWEISAVIPGTANPVKIKNVFTGLHLTVTVAPGSSADLPLIQSADANSPYQLWTIIEIAPGKVHIVNEPSGRAVDIPNSTMAPAAKLIAYPMNRALNQEWYLQSQR